MDERLFFDKRLPLVETGYLLPHWHQDYTYVFITMHLGDALPQDFIREYKHKKDKWLLAHPKPWDIDIEREYHTLFRVSIERKLDSGFGQCYLAKNEVAEVVANCIMFDDTRKYGVDSFVIMANHIHVLLYLYEERLETIMTQWRNITTHRINKIVNRHGALWQREYYDRLIRDDQHYGNVLRYIAHNNNYGGIRYYNRALAR